MENFSSAVIMISRQGMGNAEPELGYKLIQTYLTLLSENPQKPSAIVFYTEGVKLLCEGSPVISLIETLEKAGVRIVACTTCLNYYNLMDKLKVGIPGSMGDVLTYQVQASKVITL